MSLSATSEHSLSSSDRRFVLISHANPEDNKATFWFATQLANEGYGVWSDIITLLGGENFWADIEQAIRTGQVRSLL